MKIWIMYFHRSSGLLYTSHYVFFNWMNVLNCYQGLSFFFSMLKCLIFLPLNFFGLRGRAISSRLRLGGGGSFPSSVIEDNRQLLLSIGKSSTITRFNFYLVISNFSYVLLIFKSDLILLFSYYMWKNPLNQKILSLPTKQKCPFTFLFFFYFLQIISLKTLLYCRCILSFTVSQSFYIIPIFLWPSTTNYVKHFVTGKYSVDLSFLCYLIYNNFKIMHFMFYIRYKHYSKLVQTLLFLFYCIIIFWIPNRTFKM